MCVGLSQPKGPICEVIASRNEWITPRRMSGCALSAREVDLKLLYQPRFSLFSEMVHVCVAANSCRRQRSRIGLDGGLVCQVVRFALSSDRWIFPRVEHSCRLAPSPRVLQIQIQVQFIQLQFIRSERSRSNQESTVPPSMSRQRQIIATCQPFCNSYAKSDFSHFSPLRKPQQELDVEPAACLSTDRHFPWTLTPRYCNGSCSCCRTKAMLCQPDVGFCKLDYTGYLPLLSSRYSFSSIAFRRLVGLCQCLRQRAVEWVSEADLEASCFWYSLVLEYN